MRGKHEARGRARGIADGHGPRAKDREAWLVTAPIEWGGMRGEASRQGVETSWGGAEEIEGAEEFGGGQRSLEAGTSG